MLGPRFSYTIGTGVSFSYTIDGRIKLTRSNYGAATGIIIRNVNTHNYDTLTVKYSNKTSGCALDIYAGGKSGKGINTSETVVLNNIRTSAPTDIALNISGGDGSLIITSIVLS